MTAKLDVRVFENMIIRAKVVVSMAQSLPLFVIPKEEKDIRIKSNLRSEGIAKVAYIESSRSPGEEGRQIDSLGAYDHDRWKNLKIREMYVVGVVQHEGLILDSPDQIVTECLRQNSSCVNETPEENVFFSERICSSKLTYLACAPRDELKKYDGGKEIPLEELWGISLDKILDYQLVKNID